MAFLIIYGFGVLIEGVRGKDIAKYIGRIREINYFIICLTPIFYSFIPLNINTLLSIIIFFPIFYIIVEIIMRLTPSPSGDY